MGLVVVRADWTTTSPADRRQEMVANASEGKRSGLAGSCGGNDVAGGEDWQDVRTPDVLCIYTMFDALLAIPPPRVMGAAHRRGLPASGHRACARVEVWEDAQRGWGIPWVHEIGCGMGREAFSRPALLAGLPTGGPSRVPAASVAWLARAVMPASRDRAVGKACGENRLGLPLRRPEIWATTGRLNAILPVCA